MEISKYISDFDNLPKQIQQQILDYIEFLIKKYKNSDSNVDGKNIKTKETDFFEICGIWEHRYT